MELETLNLYIILERVILYRQMLKTQSTKDDLTHIGIFDDLAVFDQKLLIRFRQLFC